MHVHAAHACMHVYMRACLHACTNTHTCKPTCTHRSMHTHIHIHMFTYTGIAHARARAGEPTLATWYKWLLRFGHLHVGHWPLRVEKLYLEHVGVQCTLAFRLRCVLVHSSRAWPAETGNSYCLRLGKAAEALHLFVAQLMLRFGVRFGCVSVAKASNQDRPLPRL